MAASQGGRGVATEALVDGSKEYFPKETLAKQVSIDALPLILILLVASVVVVEFGGIRRE